MSEALLIAFISLIGSILGAIITAAGTLATGVLKKSHNPHPGCVVVFIGSIGAVAGLVLGIVFGLAITRDGPVGDPVRPTSVVPGQATIMVPARKDEGLLSNDARSWCVGAACAPSRFADLYESNGYRNPKGVKFTAGPCVEFSIPENVSADVFDGTSTIYGILGPVRLTRVCEASFRKY